MVQDHPPVLGILPPLGHAPTTHPPLGRPTTTSKTTPFKCLAHRPALLLRSAPDAAASPGAAVPGASGRTVAQLQRHLAARPAARPRLRRRHASAALLVLVRLRLREPELLAGLLRCIKELQAREGFGNYGWRFRLLARTLGYARAERLRGFVVRTLKITPPQTLDTASWRLSS